MKIDPIKVIEQLSPSEALDILKVLAEGDEAIAARIAEIATERMSQVDPDAVAFELYTELSLLEVEEVWDRAGPSRHGYVHPTEAADEMVQEIMEPYLDEIRKLHRLKMNWQANRLCMGLLLGLYQFEQESDSEFLDWAPDVLSSFAWTVLDTWKEGQPSQDDVGALRAFIEDRLGGWSANYL